MKGGWGGVRGRQKSPKKGSFWPKNGQKMRGGGLRTPQTSQKNYILYILYYILYIIYYISYIIYFSSFYKWFLEMWRFFGSPFLADFWTSDDPYTPWTPNIILSEALNVILDHLGGFGMVFRFLKSESFWKRSYTPKSVAFGQIRGFSKRLIFLNSVLDTQNDLKPTIIQYNICCTYKKRLD